MTSSTPTLRDVAAEAGVSPMTASNALRGKPGVKESTRAKVIAAAKRLNYRINLTASMLKSGRSNIIHVIVNEFDSPFYSKLTQALSNEIVRCCIAARSASSLGKFTASTVGVSSQASSSTNGLPPLSLDSGTFVPKPVACRISPSNSCPENGLLLSACSAASGEYCVCSMNGISPRDTISLLNACVSFE